MVILVKHRSNNSSGQKFTDIAYLVVVVAAVVVNFSDAIVVAIIVVLGQVHDTVRVAARVDEPDSSQVTIATVADSNTILFL
jgi:hypothetical protein